VFVVADEVWPVLPGSKRGADFSSTIAWSIWRIKVKAENLVVPRNSPFQVVM